MREAACRVVELRADMKKNVRREIAQITAPPAHPARVGTQDGTTPVDRCGLPGGCQHMGHSKHTVSEFFAVAELRGRRSKSCSWLFSMN